MTENEKQSRLERIAFNKRWGKLRKLCGTTKRTFTGKAPRCNTNTAKKEVTLTVASKKKK